MKKLITLLVLVSSFINYAQSHSTSADDYCKLKGKRGNQLGYCSACYAEDKKIADAKIAKDKRDREKLYEENRIKKEKIEKEREEKRLKDAKESKSGEVYINMPSSTNSSNSTNSSTSSASSSTTEEKSTDKKEESSTTYYPPYVPQKTQQEQINELATGLVDLFTPSPEEVARRERQQLIAQEAYKKEQADKYATIRRIKTNIDNENERIYNWNNFRNVEYVAKIPSLLKNDAPKWTTFIKSKKPVNDSDIFGRNLKELFENKTKVNVFNKKPIGWNIAESIGFSLIPIIGQVGIGIAWDFNRPETKLKKGKFSYIETPDFFKQFIAFKVVDTYAKLNTQSILGGEKKKKTDLIFDENNILIGCIIDDSRYNDVTFQERIINNILNDKSLVYLRPNATSFIFKDKVIIINERDITMYDLNALKDRLFINLPREYYNIESLSKGKYKYAKLGIIFKVNSITYKDTSYDKAEMPVINKELAIDLKIQQDDLATEKLTDKTLVTIKGVIIGEVIKDGVADKIGLKNNDIIISFNDITTEAPFHLQWLINAYSDNKKNTIKVFRENKIIEKEVTF